MGADVAGPDPSLTFGARFEAGAHWAGSYGGLVPCTHVNGEPNLDKSARRRAPTAAELGRRARMRHAARGLVCSGPGVARCGP